MTLIEAIKAFLAILNGTSTEMKKLRQEKAVDAATINDLRYELAECKGENTQGIELLTTAIDLNGPIDDLANMVIDSDTIATPPELDEEIAIGDPEVETPESIGVVAAKAILASVAQAENVEADPEEIEEAADSEGTDAVPV